MVVTPVDVDAIRRRIDEGACAGIDLRPVRAVTMGAAFELACASASWSVSGQTEGVQLVGELAAREPLLQATLDAFLGRGAQLLDAEVCPLDRQLVTDPNMPFFMRFQQALRAQGFGDKLDYGIVGAFREMADNVIQHSSEDDTRALGIVGYRVVERAVTFSVADIGRGVLDSLRSNPRWAMLASAEEALVAAVCNNASRRTHVSQGNGFSDLHRALADLSGTLRFRSADAGLTLDGHASPRRGTTKASPNLHGFQVTVTCSLDNILILL